MRCLRARVLVTGGTGFVGGVICQRLKLLGYEVWGTCRTPPCSLYANNIFWIRPEDVLRPEFSGFFDFVVHSAAHSPASIVTPKSADGGMELLRSNIGLLSDTLAYLKNSRVRRFIFLSSVSVYDDRAPSVVDEITPTECSTPYGLSKLLGENLIRDFCPVPYTILRLPGILGPNAQPVWLVKCIRSAILGQKIVAYNKGRLFNNALWALDLANFCDTLFRSHDAGSDLFLLGLDSEILVEDIFIKISCLLEKSLDLEWRNESSGFLLNISKGIRAGFTSTSIDEVLGAQISYEKLRLEAPL